MLALAIAFLVSMVVCALVFSGFNFFSNIPMESLDMNVTSCKVTMFGAACKHGPWVQKVLNLIIVGLVIALTLLPAVDSLCLGAMERTHSCLHMYDDCSLNQFRNCRYYFSDNCVGTGLPHSTSQKSLFTKCKDPDFADRFSGRWDVRVVFPTACSRCWALDSDCKGPATNSIRMTNNKTSPEFVYDPTRFSESPAVPSEDLVLGQEIYCNCVEGIDRVGTSTGDAASLNFDPVRLTRNKTQCSGYVSAGACPASLTATAAKPPLDANATYWSEYWSDSVVGATAKQTCDWAPQEYPGYFYEALECNQGGSVLNRFVFVSSYVTITLSVLLILVGLGVQKTVQSETWSYTPHRRNEPWYWRILRHVGPG
jgi:hypothetical protein